MLMPVPEMLGPCRLTRAKFKPGRKLTTYYDAVVHMTDGDCVRSIAVAWRCNGEAGSPAQIDRPSYPQAEACLMPVAAPFRQLTANLPEWNMHVLISPLDADFVQLMRLCDQSYAQNMLATAYAAKGLGCPAAVYRIRSIRYRPGQRHVLRYGPVDATKEAVFAKLCRRESDGRRVLQATIHAGDWLRHATDDVTVVSPLAFVVEDNVVLYRELAGAPLSNRVHETSNDVATCLERTGAALNALHNLPLEATDYLDLSDFLAETAEVARASAYIKVLLPDVGAAIQAILERMQQLHERLPQEAPRFIHGDFKAEHVWVTRTGLSLIDFDSCHLGDPAFDAGKFLADLRFWFSLPRHAMQGLEWAQMHFLEGYARNVPAERLVRARLYEAQQLIKLTARRVPLFALDWECRTTRLVGEAQLALNQLELMLGLPKTQMLSHSWSREQACRGDRQLPWKGAQC